MFAFQVEEEGGIGNKNDPQEYDRNDWSDPNIKRLIRKDDQPHNTAQNLHSNRRIDVQRNHDSIDESLISKEKKKDISDGALIEEDEENEDEYYCAESGEGWEAMKGIEHDVEILKNFIVEEWNSTFNDHTKYNIYHKSLEINIHIAVEEGQKKGIGKSVKLTTFVDLNRKKITVEKRQFNCLIGFFVLCTICNLKVRSNRSCYKFYQDNLESDELENVKYFQFQCSNTVNNIDDDNDVYDVDIKLLMIELNNSRDSNLDENNMESLMEFTNKKIADYKLLNEK